MANNYSKKKINSLKRRVLHQTLLKRNRTTAQPLLTVDCVAGDLTITAIKEFQAHVVKMPKSDGRVAQAYPRYCPTTPFSYCNQIAWDIKVCDIEMFKKFFHGMLAEDVYLAPSAYEACFVSSAHSDADITASIDAAGRVFTKLK